MADIPNNATETWMIGAAPDCDLIERQPTVSQHHCRLLKRGGEFFVEDLNSTNGTFLDGLRLAPNQPSLIGPQALVTLGSSVPMPWPRPKHAAPPPVAPPPVAPPPVAPPPSAPPAPAMAAPPPVRSNGGAAHMITIGRDPASDIAIDLPIVSWNHARITQDGGRYYIEDLGSTNGTSMGRLGNRITRVEFDPTCEIYLGSYKISGAELLRGKKVEVGNAAYEKIEFRGDSMLIGRNPQCDVPLDQPMISWEHARLTRVAEGILVEDLGSRNGTFVAGKRVQGKAIAKLDEEIGLGSFRFQLMASGEIAQRQYYGNLTIEAEDVIVNAPNGKRLIEPVSLTIFPSELVAVMGGAGAGKTSLIKALNGYTKPAQGRVLVNGDSLYQFYDRFRQQMGYVPQDDIVHPQLTVGEALYFSARLRTDLTDSEIDTRIVKILDQLSMGDKRHTVIGSAEKKTLSGGQRKRVNIALELMADTPVLFLDEPTSGLSSYDAESVVALLKDLSKQGKTVVTTIHQPSLKIYKMFDDLLMVNRDKGGATGSMVYFGPAFPDSIQFFNDPEKAGGKPAPDLSPEMLLSDVASRPCTTWQAAYKKSRYQREFVEGRSGKQPPAGDEPTTDHPKRHFDLVQMWALIRRNVLVKKSDKVQTAILFAQAPLFALLICLIYRPLNAGAGFMDLSPKLAGTHFLMVIAALWFGCNNAARDIVGEWTVYKRERMVTLKLAPYVFSKLAVLFALCIIQCVSLLTIVWLALGLKSGYGTDLIVLIVSALIGTGLGLCISAFSETTESAIALLPIVLLPIIALGGGMRPVYQIDSSVRWITNAIPSRWAFEANLLKEIRKDGWTWSDKDGKGADATDALSDPLDPTQQRQLENKGKADATKQMNPKAPAPPAPKNVDESPDRILRGDVAEITIPKYLIEWTDKDGKQVPLRAIAASETINGQGYTATSFRHSFRDSLLVLLGMLVALILAVHAILMKRDKDPQ